MTRINCFILLLLLSCACTPQPEPSVSDTTTTAVPPIATSQPAVIAAGLPAPTRTAVPPTATQTPTATPPSGVTVLPPITTTPPAEPTPIATSDISRFSVFISSQGQLAYVDDLRLFVENPVGSGEFVLISEAAGTISWSPDGSKLLFNVGEEEIGLTDYLVWYADTAELRSLKASIHNFPQQPSHDYALAIYPCLQPSALWLPDSERILFQNLEDRSEGDPETTYTSLTDLNQATHITLAQTNPRRSCVFPINNELYLDVSIYVNGSGGTAIDYTGQVSWQFGADINLRDQNTWQSIATQAFHFRANYGGELPLALEALDMQTGAVSLLWEDTEGIFGNHGYWLSLSPQGRFIAFHAGQREPPGYVLFVIDTNGNEIDRYVQTEHVFWRNNDEGYIMDRQLNGGQTLPIYVSLPDGKEQALQPALTGLFFNGEWSPDGRYFAYQSYDSHDLQLYLWQVGQREANLIYTFDNSDIQRAGMDWHPNSNQLYVTTSQSSSGDWELRMLNVSTSVWHVLAASAEP
jgi:hypothetical protein